MESWPTRFVEFLLSPEGQRLWILRAGQPGGPVERALRRPPVRQDLYADRTGWSDDVNPFAESRGFNQRADFMKLYVAREAPAVYSPVLQGSCPVVYMEAMGIDGVACRPDPIQAQPVYVTIPADFTQRRFVQIGEEPVRLEVLAAGRHQMSFVTQSAIMGGHVRVGLEDSLYLGKGQLARSNAEQVAKIRRILEELSLIVASPEEARAMLDLKGGDQVAF